MKIKGLFKFLFLIVVSLLFVACNDDLDQRLPSLGIQKDGFKEINVNFKANMSSNINTRYFEKGGIGAEFVSGQKVPKVKIDWTKLKWSSPDETPYTIAYVYDRDNPENIVKTPLYDFVYASSGFPALDDFGFWRKHQNNGVIYNPSTNKDVPPSIHINSKIKYLAGVPLDRQVLKIYLCDLSASKPAAPNYGLYGIKSKNYFSVAYENPNRLSNMKSGYFNAEPKITFVFETTIAKLKEKNGSIKDEIFKPLGTMLLFQLKNEFKKVIPYPTKIHITTSMFSFEHSVRAINKATGLAYPVKDRISSGFSIVKDAKIDLTHNDNSKFIQPGQASELYGLYLYVNELPEGEPTTQNISVVYKYNNETIAGSESTIAVENYIERLNGNSVYMVTSPSKNRSGLEPADWTIFKIRTYKSTKRNRKVDVDLKNKLLNQQGKEDNDVLIKWNTRYNPGDDPYTWNQGNNTHYVKEIPQLNENTDYYVAVWGINRLDFNESGGSRTFDIYEVNQWGTSKFVSFEDTFLDCIHLQVKATDTPNLSRCRSLVRAFSGCTNIRDGFSQWDISNITSPESMFEGARNFNDDLSNWETHNVTSMKKMFNGAERFNNKGRTMSTRGNKWNISRVDSINYMFADAKVFNQDVSNWDTSNVKTMVSTFSGAERFNQNLSAWDTHNVTDMSYMFSNAKLFNNKDNSLKTNGNIWNTSAVVNMKAMFRNAEKFNQDISNWNTANVQNMSEMFASAHRFNVDITSWNTANVADMSSMFQDTHHFNLNLTPNGDRWNTGNVLNMRHMFKDARVFVGNGIEFWNVSRVKNMESMFALSKQNNPRTGQPVRYFGQNTRFNPDFSRWKTDSLQRASEMFSNRSNHFTGRGIGNWHTQNLYIATAMFYNCQEFNQDLNTRGNIWNVSSLQFAKYMFAGCIKFDGNLADWNLASLKYASYMFDMGKLIYKVTSAGDQVYDPSREPRGVFTGKGLDSWEPINVEEARMMFYSNKRLNKNLSSWRFSSKFNSSDSGSYNVFANCPNMGYGSSKRPPAVRDQIERHGW